MVTWCPHLAILVDHLCALPSLGVEGASLRTNYPHLHALPGGLIIIFGSSLHDNFVWPPSTKLIGLVHGGYSVWYELVHHIFKALLQNEVLLVCILHV